METVDIDFLLTRGVAQVEKETDLRRLLEAGGRHGRPLRVKLGFDPRNPDMTLGHGVVLRKLRQFQQLGHKAVVIVGDWTARLGDPSGRSEAREALSAEQVKANAEKYLDQFYQIVDREQTEVRWQSEWFDRFTLTDAIRLAGNKTVAQMLERDDFSKRYHAGTEIYLSEFLYPLLQGYDSVAVEADVELGGTDQTFNLLVGRELQGRIGQPPQQILTCHLIVGLDGVQKMGKSLGNYIALTAAASDMYGKLMSLPDQAMMTYFETLTTVPTEELREMQRKMAEGSLNPRDVKMRMAREIVTELRSAEAAAEAEAAFVRQFQRRQLPEQIPDYRLAESTPIVALMADAGLAPSRGRARDLIQQGGVYLYPEGEQSEAQRITDVNHLVPAKDGAIVQVGKLQFVRIRVS
jgi:tyrosyl-tRNA synthetase